MRVAVIGLGAIGHVIARALAGRCDLVPIDRTRAPLRDDEPSVAAAVICVKTPGTLWAAEVAARVLAADGVALTIQNGIGNYETLVAHVGRERAAVGVVYVGAQLLPAGELKATGAGKVVLGRLAGQGPRARLDELAELLAAGGMQVDVVDDPWPAVWGKLATNAAVNPLTALLGETNAALLADPAAALVADLLAREVARVATASGVPIAEDDAVRDWRATVGVTGTNRSSMLQDVAAARPTEIDAICGAVAREAERRGIAAPLNQAMALLVASLPTCPPNVSSCP